MSGKRESGLAGAQIVAALLEIDVEQDQVALVYSAVRTFGHIEEGAETVVDAFLEILGPGGTLVVPTFTFCHEAGDAQIIDLQRDPSDMGAITEALRCRPKAVRSTADRHSFAGPRETGRGDHPSRSFSLLLRFALELRGDAGTGYPGGDVWHDLRQLDQPPFRRVGVRVSYRQMVPRQVRVRRGDGILADQVMTDYQPKSEGGSYYGSRHSDFNRLGQRLKETGVVGTAFIGNAAVRRYSMRGLVGLAEAEAALDENIFLSAEGAEGTSELAFGTKVLRPVMSDGDGRADTYEWCVRDPQKLVMPG